jgi:hypothetical protein
VFFTAEVVRSELQTQPVGKFQLATTFLSSENILKRRSRSACCAYKLLLLLLLLLLIIIIIIIIKGKVHPRIGHESPEGEQRYSSTISLTSALDWGGWLTTRPGLFTPGNDPVPIL